MSYTIADGEAAVTACGVGGKVFPCSCNPYGQSLLRLWADTGSIHGSQLQPL